MCVCVCVCVCIDVQHWDRFINQFYVTKMCFAITVEKNISLICEISCKMKSYKYKSWSKVILKVGATHPHQKFGLYQTWKQMPFEIPFCRLVKCFKIMLSMIPVNYMNQTEYAMIHRIWILIERRRYSILHVNEGLQHSDEDWTKIQHIFLMLWLELLPEDWI